MKKLDFSTITDSFKTRSFRAGGYSIVATAIVLAIVLAVNLLAGALPKSMTQWDLTADRMFTLSEQTQQVLGNLEKDVTIYWVVTENQEDAYVEKLLARLEELTDRLTVVRKDTDIYPTFAANYTSDTVNNNSLIVECGQKYRYLDVNTDIFTYDYADYYTTGKETWYFNGEGAVVSAVDYVTSDKQAKLYALTGHGEQNLSTTFETAVKNLNVDMAQLSLLSTGSVPEDADAVLICSPSADITETELKILQDYTAVGGNLMVLTGPRAQGETLPNVERLMADYGMSAIPGMVVETNAGYYFSMYQQAIPHMLLPELVSHDMTDALISGNYRLLFNGAHGIKISKELPEELSVTQLLSTSYGAFSKLAGTNLDSYDKQTGDIDGPFALAALATKNQGAEGESNVIWVSSVTLVSDDVNNIVSGGNQDLFLNMLSYLCKAESADYAIHAKTVGNIKLLTMEGGTAALLAILVVAVIPMAYLAIGVVVWYRRKHR